MSFGTSRQAIYSIYQPIHIFNGFRLMNPVLIIIHIHSIFKYHFSIPYSLSYYLFKDILNLCTYFIYLYTYSFHILIHVYSFTYSFIHLFTYTHSCILIHIFIHVYSSMYTHSYIHSCILIHIFPIICYHFLVICDNNHI